LFSLVHIDWYVKYPMVFLLSTPFILTWSWYVFSEDNFYIEYSLALKSQEFLYCLLSSYFENIVKVHVTHSYVSETTIGLLRGGVNQ
jgi:hypothetical protein